MRKIGLSVIRMMSLLVLTTTLFSGQLFAGDGADITYADIFSFQTNGIVGTSKLVRNDNGISVNIDTTDLVKGDAYSIWLILFNNNFSFAVATNVAGGLAGGNGNGNFAGHFSVGVLPPVDGETVLISIGGVFDDPRGVNARLIIRSHGPKIPGQQQEQFSTILGGCPPNICEDVQVSFHPGL